MTTISDITAQATSTKPYLLRALYEWCTDNGFTPYVAVYVNGQAVVPREYVKNGEIVLNLSFDATQALSFGNDALTFKARFSGVARDIYVPIDNIVAIYARENGQGMAFPLSPELQREQAEGPRASEAVHGLKLATAQTADPAEADASRAAPIEPPKSVADKTPASIKSARSSRRPKLASSAKVAHTSPSTPADATPAAPAADAQARSRAEVRAAAQAKVEAMLAASELAADIPLGRPGGVTTSTSESASPTPPTPPTGGRPALKRVK